MPANFPEFCYLSLQFSGTRSGWAPLHNLAEICWAEECDDLGSGPPFAYCFTTIVEAECVAAPPSKANEMGLFRGMRKKWTVWEHDEGHEDFSCGLD